ncbi:hypothetical protein M422DRAFT_32455 [Sphaerobolus stellatus SS14]|uniref:Unplaced genomic scaffold SPHSTscaffold_73, whole genome shotgun sequence n=1 Tax=Sphaerobolus stellatus (strain SS14) TaxID=990650 RepID=A0A0C9VEP6_SPHS4|nr:hypothetical protein M422DRAFT_32455 [Sphaerobolus stellatus SS14]
MESSEAERNPAASTDRDKMMQPHLLEQVKPTRLEAVIRNKAINQGRIRAIMSSFVLAILVVLYRGIPHKSGRVPNTYALCSPQGKIYTVDPSRSQTDCILVHEGYIFATGTLDEVRQKWKSETGSRIVPIRLTKSDSIVVPGMTDSHGHILEYGKKLMLDLDELPTRQEAVERIRAYIEARPSVLNNTDAWIEGGGWDHTSWPEGTWPTAADLEADPVVRNRPIVLLSKDGHAFWVSQKVIDQGGPFPDNVEGGVIFRDSEGQPTGTFLDRAMDSIHPPPWTEEQKLEYFEAAVQSALANGLTRITDAGLNSVLVDFIENFSDHNILPIRIYAMRPFNESQSYWGKDVPKILEEVDGRFTARSVKIFADGALRSGGAALYEPYSDNPSTRGFFRIDPEILKDVIPRFLKDGWQVNTHCIGDRANGMFIDLFENITNQVNLTALRPRVEHAQILAPGDFSRMGKVGVIASVQPSHVIDDMPFVEDRLGPERVKGTYAFRTLIQNGVPIALGTDFPVANINPMETFYAAVTRLSLAGDSPHGPEGWFPEQRLTREEALKGLTLDAAYASFSEITTGSLTPGKRADYVILSKDIMSIPPADILATKVLATVIDGAVAYGKI